MLLLEADQEFEFVPVNIRAGEQHKPEFLAINPAGKVPVLSDGDRHQTESNSILLSLANKTGWGLAKDTHSHEELTAWLFYQASTQGPHCGQIEYWSGHAKVPNPEALAHHRAIAGRTIGHLNEMLAGKQFFCGDAYTIADIALFPWLHIHNRLGLSLEKTENLAGWLERARNRPATLKARAFFGPSSIF